MDKVGSENARNAEIETNCDDTLPKEHYIL